MRALIDKLAQNNILSADEFANLIANRDPNLHAYAAGLAREAALSIFGNKIYIRGLIEFTNYCRNNCYYCGIRSGNADVERYRLGKDDILAAAEEGARLGFRTFVLQGGEDSWFDDDILVDIVAALRAAHPDCAITLSVGERSFASYEKLYQAGANRYLLRHETASPEHYAMLHPQSLSLANRTACLWNLKKIGFQTGSGFMVGSPYQTADNLAQDMLFLARLQPEMIGIGPFIPHRDTPFADKPSGSVDQTVFLLSLIRLMLPKVLLPATTALGSLAGDGRERGVLAGANVVMPNLSPLSVRDRYMLYNNKAFTDLEAAENISGLQKKMASIGYQVVFERGDAPGNPDSR
ncbi:MAG: [FeFe] hydrogenase H-cluster radical SAM maturase HydE [Planctomycetes bacterium]|nr:[FeFe] hydrogenase H-cluster radical SAM maturase HydE [Planctomycetota bacterium]